MPAARYASTPNNAERIPAAREILAEYARSKAPAAGTPSGKDGGRGVGAAAAVVESGGLAAAAAVEAAELEARAAVAVAAAAAAALETRAAEGSVAPGEPRPAVALGSAARVAHPTPNVAPFRPRGSPFPLPTVADGGGCHGTRTFTATDEARLAKSPMRTQDAAREPTAELTSLHARYKNALRAVLPAGVTRPAELGDLGLSAVACIRSTLFTQAELASANLGDVERLAARSRSARAVCERLREDVRDQTTCDAIKSSEVQV